MGRLLGVKTYLAGAIPAGNGPDNIYFVRLADMLLFQSPPKVLVAPNPLSGTMQIRLRLHKYVAFVGNRFSSGLAVITNCPQPANY
jgi:hypothetical protein